MLSIVLMGHLAINVTLLVSGCHYCEKDGCLVKTFPPLGSWICCFLSNFNCSRENLTRRCWPSHGIPSGFFKVGLALPEWAILSFSDSSFGSLGLLSQARFLQLGLSPHTSLTILNSIIATECTLWTYQK